MDLKFFIIVILVCSQLVDCTSINKEKTASKAYQNDSEHMAFTKGLRDKRFFDYFKIIVNYEVRRTLDGRLLFVPVDKTKNHYFIG